MLVVLIQSVTVQGHEPFGPLSYKCEISWLLRGRAERGRLTDLKRSEAGKGEPVVMSSLDEL